MLKSVNRSKILGNLNSESIYNFSAKYTSQYYCSKCTEVLNLIMEDKIIRLIRPIRSLKWVEIYELWATGEINLTNKISKTR